MKRIAALDGLRGVAIITVILTHVPVGQIITATPQWLRPALSVLFGNGGVGVAILFILTGFLMASIYPNPHSALSFWSKRLARLLPPFLVMVVSLSIIRFYPLLLPVHQMLIVLSVAIVARGLWEVGVLMNQRLPMGKILTIGWLSFQAVVALWYVFILQRTPASVFFMIWNPVSRALSTLFVNASLTLPFGQYIGQIDGVYWSLVTEMFFYLIYPFIFVPILNYSRGFSAKMKLVLFLTTIPACFGLGVIAKRLLGFEIMNIHSMLYFICGAVIGFNLGWFQDKVKKYQKIVFHPLMTIFILFLVFYSQRLLFPHFSRFYTPLVSLLAAFPISLLLIMTTMQNSKFAQWFSHPILMYLGKISFSLYLTHAFIIDILEVFILPTTALSQWILIAATLLAAIIFSTMTFFIIEKPYYDVKKSKRLVDISVPLRMRSYRLSVGITTVLIFGATYIALRAPISLFSSAASVGQPSAKTLILGEIPEEITTTPYSISFKSDEKGLGMITAHIRSISKDSTGDYPSSPPQLIISLFDERQVKIASSNYKSADIYEDTHHPFGFPVMGDSKGKTYTVTYQLSEMDPTKKLVIVNSGTQVKPIYLANKAELFQHPLQLIKFIGRKIIEPITLPMFWLISLYLAPFISLLWVGSMRQDIMTS